LNIEERGIWAPNSINWLKLKKEASKFKLNIEHSTMIVQPETTGSIYVLKLSFHGYIECSINR
jgi:hypothetical protein